MSRTADRRHDDVEGDDKQLAAIARSTLPETGGALGGALLGLAIGGPLGALAGAATTPAAVALTRLTHRAIALRRERAGKVLEAAAAETDGGMPSLEQQLVEDDDRLNLAAELLAEASKTRLPEKATALARMLTAIARADQPTIDVYAMLVRAIGDISKPHVTILHLLASDSSGATNSVEWTPESIGSAVGRPPEALRSVVRQLELYGLITDIGWQYEDPSIKVRWTITDQGRALLSILETADR